MRPGIYKTAGIIAVVVVALVLVWSFMRKGAEQGHGYKTARVERGSIVVKVTESGEVAPLTIVNVKSELAGEVKQLFVEEGDSVQAGDRLALVQQESSQAQQIAQARASVERAKIDLEDAERNLQRQRDLFGKGFIAKKDVEDAEQEYRLSQIQHDLSEKQLWVVLGGGDEEEEPGGLGVKAFDNITVTAPISGLIISLDVEQGEMITSGTQAYGGGGTVLMTIADLSKMIVTANVNEVDVGKIKVGQPAQIGFDAIRDRVYHGVVKRIAPAGTLDGNVVVFPVEVEITGSTSGQFQKLAAGESAQSGGGRLMAGLSQEQRDALREKIREARAGGADQEEIRSIIEKAAGEVGGEARPQTPAKSGEGTPPETEASREGIALIKPGMTADLDIIIAEAENVLLAPKEAVTEQNGKSFVMLREGEEVVSRPVVTGLEDNVSVEIKEGLQEGDEVITSGIEQVPSQGLQSAEARGPRPGPPR
jgi:HlyD family secretion protein